MTRFTGDVAAEAAVKGVLTPHMPALADSDDHQQLLLEILAREIIRTLHEKGLLAGPDLARAARDEDFVAARLGQEPHPVESPVSPADPPVVWEGIAWRATARNLASSLLRAMDEAEAQARLAARMAVAITLTQEYVGSEVLPALPGWEWWDALEAYRASGGVRG